MSGKTNGKRATRSTSKSTTNSKAKSKATAAKSAAAKSATKPTASSGGAPEAAESSKSSAKKKSATTKAAKATKATASTAMSAASTTKTKAAKAVTAKTAKSPTPTPAPVAASQPPEAGSAASTASSTDFAALSAQLSAVQQKLDALVGSAALAPARDDRRGGDHATNGNGNGNGTGTTVHRAAAAFERLVADAVEDQLAEILPPLIALRRQIAPSAATNGKLNGDLRSHAAETLDHVLAVAGVETFEARTGDSCDPLIHLAVGETQRDDLPSGTVAEPLQPGFRSRRGKVLVPARVRVNRR